MANDKKEPAAPADAAAKPAPAAKSPPFWQSFLILPSTATILTAVVAGAFGIAGTVLTLHVKPRMMIAAADPPRAVDPLISRLDGIKSMIEERCAEPPKRKASAK